MGNDKKYEPLPLSHEEIESIKNTIKGMSEQEKRIVAEELPIEVLFDRIKSDFFVMKQNLNRIADIVN